MKLVAGIILTLVILLASASRPASAVAAVVVPTIEPLEEDIETIDGIIRAFYSSVQVLPEQKRMWARDKTLYSAWVRFVFLDRNGNAQSWTHQELVDASEPLVAGGFKEEEINRVVTRYGSVAHVYSTYSGVVAGNPPVHFRGVNSLQLFHDGKRWWIIGVAWQSETNDHPIPGWLLDGKCVDPANQEMYGEASPTGKAD